MRKKRAKMVRRFDQYRFVIECLLTYIYGKSYYDNLSLDYYLSDPIDNSNINGSLYDEDLGKHYALADMDWSSGIHSTANNTVENSCKLS